MPIQVIYKARKHLFYSYPNEIQFDISASKGIKNFLKYMGKLAPDNYEAIIEILNHQISNDLTIKDVFLAKITEFIFDLVDKVIKDPIKFILQYLFLLNTLIYETTDENNKQNLIKHAIDILRLEYNGKYKIVDCFVDLVVNDVPFLKILKAASFPIMIRTLRVVEPEGLASMRVVFLEFLKRLNELLEKQTKEPDIKITVKKIATIFKMNGDVGREIYTFLQKTEKNSTLRDQYTKLLDYLNKNSNLVIKLDARETQLLSNLVDQMSNILYHWDNLEKDQRRSIYELAKKVLKLDALSRPESKRFIITSNAQEDATTITIFENEKKFQQIFRYESDDEIKNIMWLIATGELLESVLKNAKSNFLSSRPCPT